MRKVLYLVMVASCSLFAANETTSVRPYLAFRSLSENSARSMAGMNRFYHKVAVTVDDEVVPTKIVSGKKIAVGSKKNATIESEKITDIDSVQGKDVKVHASRVKTLQASPFIRAEQDVSTDGYWEKTKAYIKNIFSKKSNTMNPDAALYMKNAAVEVSSVSSPLGHYGVLSVTPEYTRSFDGDEITQSLFGWWLQDCTTLKITGSKVANRNEKDLLADWFYLDGNYQGSISFEPVIQNALVDLSIYWGMDAWVDGLYLRAHAPLAWTKWDLGATFKTTEPGTLVDGGYTYLDTSEKYFCEKDVLVTNLETVYHPLTSARFCGCSCDDAKTLVRLSDIQVDLGWDFLRRDRGHLGVYVRGVAPTGNRPTGRWLFEPVIGNGHHWELGGGLAASAVLWNSKTHDRSINFSFDAHATHLFKALQHRVFDLKDMPLSRYMTAFRSNKSEMAPVANLTSTTINSSFAVQGELTAVFNILIKNWLFDFGYNFWAQSCEKIACSSWSHNCYGKGVIENGYSELLIDSSKWQVDFESTINLYHQPVNRELLESSDIDYEGARSKGMSHKIFGHVSYAWMDREVIPMIGLGVEAEFGRNDTCGSCASSSTCSENCCNHVSFSQWGVLLKGGVSF